nr:MAG TPA: hypothetical protein [Caudoviricetes sp.]
MFCFLFSGCLTHWFVLCLCWWCVVCVRVFDWCVCVVCLCMCVRWCASHASVWVVG